ncbi:alpha-xylosidase [Mobiluncus mulieris]|uniref:alpha-D-xyloside xylohydrolase n=2 Tax=Mobiluncus mulieris TaxID=2052 RepID=A0A7Y0U0I2_9ACTO|nr:alpha-xylosidase [Mobiluncus mulieris]
MKRFDEAAKPLLRRCHISREATMKFTDGYWLKRKGWTVFHPRQVVDLKLQGNTLKVVSSTRVLQKRGDELDSVQVTTSLTPVADGVIKVRVEHYRGYVEPQPSFTLNNSGDEPIGNIEVDYEELSATVHAGALYAHISGQGEFNIVFSDCSQELTRSKFRCEGVAVSPDGEKFIHEQLVIQPGEFVYGLGERFGPVVKNGQVVDMWNADAGTASEMTYINVPFYLTNRGYGVFVNHPEKVSFEVGSEVNTRVQFSVPGEFLEYYIIYGPTPKEILSRYTLLTGRAPQVPAWTYGLWLSTSFTTDYSEDTVNQFIDRMEELDIPISVMHFDCYWMRPSHWCDFTWNPEFFKDPEGMLKRLHDRGIKVCVWINPYVGQISDFWEEGKERGYFLKCVDGSIRQWDHWQSGMAWVDFTNPEAREWYKTQIKKLLRQGVDCFKTDFGERVPTDVVWYNGEDVNRMHNYYTFLYNQTVFQAIREERGENEALVFARSGTAGGQQFPVHWGGDSEPTFESMGETLRGGLSLGLSGYGYWSHDMGGFEGKPNPSVFIRWYPFGMLSSHSRLHGSSSYRVPWMYGEDAVQVAKRFTALKNRLMPYLMEVAEEVTEKGIPILRHMILENPQDLGSAHVDTQYYLGSKIIVAPVLSESGDVDYYLPYEGWTNLLNGERKERSGWYHEKHGLDSLPVMVPDGTILPIGCNRRTPQYDWSEKVCLYIFNPDQGELILRVPNNDENEYTYFQLTRNGQDVEIVSNSPKSWSVNVIGTGDLNILQGELSDEVFSSEIVAGKHIFPKNDTGGKCRKSIRFQYA